MSEIKYCQGPRCHEYRTKDRISGSKGDKHYEPRKRSRFYNLGGNACSMQCERDWYNKFGDQAVNHFGRIREPKRTDSSDAWYKYRDWRQERYYFANDLLDERRPITQQQYESADDDNYQTLLASTNRP